MQGPVRDHDEARARRLKDVAVPGRGFAGVSHLRMGDVAAVVHVGEPRRVQRDAAGVRRVRKVHTVARKDPADSAVVCPCFQLLLSSGVAVDRPAEQVLATVPVLVNPSGNDMLPVQF